MIDKFIISKHDVENRDVSLIKICKTREQAISSLFSIVNQIDSSDHTIKIKDDCIKIYKKGYTMMEYLVFIYKIHELGEGIEDDRLDKVVNFSIDEDDEPKMKKSKKNRINPKM